VGILIAFLMCGIISAVIASNKGRSTFGWFLIGTLTSLFGIILALVVSDKSAKAADSAAASLTRESAQSAIADTRACPYCAETIKAQAVICRFCNRDVDPLPITQINLSHDELMAKYQINHDGSQYLFEQYRYDRLEDAVAYALRKYP